MSKEEIQIIYETFMNNNTTSYTDIKNDIELYIKKLFSNLSIFENNFKNKANAKIIYKTTNTIVQNVSSNKINDSIYLNNTFFIGRTGVLGLDALLPFIFIIVNEKTFQTIINNPKIRKQIKEICHNESGIYEIDDNEFNKTLTLYLQMYIQSCRNCTHFKIAQKSTNLAQFFLSFIVSQKNIVYDLNCEWKNFDIHPHPNGRRSWIEFFTNKKMLFITAFPKTAKQQLKNGNLYKMFGLNPDDHPLSIKFVKSPVSFCGNTPHKNILESFNELKKSVAEKEFDIAVIGCGAYSMIIGDFIYTQLNKSSIITGGTVQLWFGIRGKRWDKYDIYNEYWCDILKEEVPTNSYLVENGCYF